jgi:hypothetical protein
LNHLLSRHHGLSVALLCATLFWATGCKDEPEQAQSEERGAQEIGAQEIVDKSWTFYQTRPYYQQPMAPTAVPEGLPDLRAQTCGACHQEIYKEWKLSTHRRAWTDDAQYQAELSKSRGEHKPDIQDDVGWMCVNCHTPAFEQLPEVVIGLKDGNIGKPVYAKNPKFDKTLQDEAITCASCHVKDGVVYGPYGDTDAPHPTAKDPTLRTEAVCTQCHQAEAEWPQRSLGCYFTTGEEWAASTFAETNQTCQSCHMPKVERKLAKAFDRPKRTTRRHWFGGSLIPKHPDYAKDLAPLRKVYGTGVELELIAAKQGSERGPVGEPDPEFNNGSTSCAEGESCTKLWVRVTNKNAGHKFPTGDPERHADVEVVARDSNGDVLARARDRIASRYKWWPEIEKLTDNRIDPGQHHDIVLEVPTDDSFDVEIQGHKYRMYQEAFEHHELDGEYVRGRKFHESTWSVGDGGEPSLVEISDDWGERKTLSHQAQSTTSDVPTSRK